MKKINMQDWLKIKKDMQKKLNACNTQQDLHMFMNKVAYVVGSVNKQILEEKK